MFRLGLPEKPATNPHTPIVYVRDVPKWDYKQVLRTDKDASTLSEGELNELGEEGWELAAAFAVGDGFNYIFKRIAG
jgi:hypothetical protein